MNHEFWQNLYATARPFFIVFLGAFLVAMNVFVVFVACFSSAKTGYCLVGAIKLGYGPFYLFPNDANKETVWLE